MQDGFCDAFLKHMLYVDRLDRLPRAGYVLTGVPAPESVASHSFSVAYIVMVLGRQLVASGVHIDIGKALQMSLLHESGEAFIGDMVPDGKRAFGEAVKIAAEKKAGQANLITIDSGLAAEFAAFFDEDSPEARLVKDCDLLQFILKSAVYTSHGFLGVREFVDEKRCVFHYDLCKQIGLHIVEWVSQS